jgi:hypothetical protein
MWEWFEAASTKISQMVTLALFITRFPFLAYSIIQPINELTILAKLAV